MVISARAISQVRWIPKLAKAKAIVLDWQFPSLGGLYCIVYPCCSKAYTYIASWISIRVIFILTFCEVCNIFNRKPFAFEKMVLGVDEISFIIVLLFFSTFIKNLSLNNETFFRCQFALLPVKSNEYSLSFLVSTAFAFSSKVINVPFVDHLFVSSGSVLVSRPYSNVH